MVRAVHALGIALALLLSTLSAAAAEVEVSVSQRETEIGLPVVLSIDLINASTYERPKIPAIPGAAVQADPSEQTSSMTSIINGQMTQRNTRSLRYRVVPHREGTITIPSLSVVADGQTFTTQPIDIVVSKSQGGDLLLMNVKAEQTSVFLGQPLKLTLQIWVRPYQDKQYNVRLSPSDMWSMVDIASSTWGDFSDALAQARDPFGGARISAQEQLRTDSDGNSRAYYVYELPVTIWPQQAGTLTLEQPRVVLDYPVRLARSDAFFPTGRLAIAEARKVSATAELPPVEIKTAPEANQPPSFNGAVGQYEFTVSAKPLEVAVGDPITLTMRVFDRSGSGSRLDLLAPPALDRNAELNEDFRIPSEPLAGTVSGSTKTFTQTLRAKHANVTQIPPIEFTFFDPVTETYITRASEPIAITVRPGSQLGVNEVVTSPNLAPAAPSELTAATGGLLANYADLDLMLASQEFRIPWWSWAILALPPLGFVGVSIGRVVHRMRHGDERAARRRTARKRAIAHIRQARRSAPRDQAQAVIAAVSEYIADRLALPGGTLTGNEVSSLLAHHGVAGQHAADISQLIRDCEQLAFAGDTNMLTQDDIIRRATSCVDRLERVRLNSINSSTHRSAPVRSIPLIFLAICAFIAMPSQAAELSPQQRRDVLTEAQAAYDRAISILRTDPAGAKTDFALAASRFQLVVDTGLVNGQLFYNLANAYAQSGDVGRAILNYRRAQDVIPGDPRLQANLSYARSLCRTQIPISGGRQLLRALLGWHDRLSPQTRFVAFLAVHVAMWSLLTLCLVRSGSMLRVVTGCFAIAWLALGISVAATSANVRWSEAGVITADDVVVRKGNGLGYEPQFQQPLYAGVEFTILERRGEWMEIELPNGDKGWIEAKAVEPV